MSAFAPDRVAVAHGAEVALVPLRIQDEPLRLPTHPSLIDGMTLSADGTRLATFTADGTIRLFDGMSGAPIKTVRSRWS